MIANHTFTVTPHKSFLDIASFIHSNFALVCCLFIVASSLLVFNGLVFRVRVVGLESHERQQVMTFLSDNGVRRMTWKRSHSNQVATTLVQEFDFIAHASMNISGSSLILNVYRTKMPPGVSTSDLVSLYDAVITHVTVLSGISQVTPGDQVRTGDVLVSAAMQVGVEVGEPDEYGRNTYKPVLAPGTAIAIVRGEVSFSAAIIAATAQEVETLTNQVYISLLLQHGFETSDQRELFKTPLPDGTTSVEVVIRRNVVLHV